MASVLFSPRSRLKQSMRCIIASLFDSRIRETKEIVRKFRPLPVEERPKLLANYNIFLPTAMDFHRHFYPLGNTPAANLARDEPIPNDGDRGEDRSLRILLLGCGDPRNILFTLEQEDGRDRKFDFTCCDWEPAVLARNVFLLTLLLHTDKWTTDTTYNSAWCTFHHFFLSKSDLQTVHEHSERLVMCSTTLYKWKNSQYGEVIKVVDKHTLEVIRDIWQSWAAGRTYSVEERARFEARFRAEIKAITDKRKMQFGNNSIYHRSSLLFEPEISIKLAAYNFDQFWKTGVIAGNSADISALGKNGKGHTNPLFVFSTGNAQVHYGTEPSGSYDLSPVFAQSPDPREREKDPTVAITNLVKQQFRNRCQAFVRTINAKNVVIRFFSGDALALCQTLRHLNEPLKTGTMIYTQPWTFTPLIVDNPCELPTCFEVIDTSNVADHIGILNVLIATAPLLANRPSSTLYTENMPGYQKDNKEALLAPLFIDTTTMSIILGVAPAGHLHGISTYNNFHGKFHNRIAWKIPSGGDTDAAGKPIPILIHPTQVANALFVVYQEMFDIDPLPLMMKFLSKSEIPKLFPYSQYLRPGFVALIAFAKERLNSDWECAMDLLISKIENYRGFIFNSNYLQELHLHLYLTGSSASSKFKVRPRGAPNLIPYLRTAIAEIDYLKEESLVSTIVILVIPRKKLSLLTTIDKEKLVQPQIIPCISQVKGNSQFLNCYGLMHCAFGKLNIVEGRPVIDEDKAGWYGGSDLVVQFRAPTYNLLYGARDGIRIGLRAFSGIPEITKLLVKTLGVECVIYEAGLNDENVYVGQRSIKTRKYQDVEFTVCGPPSISTLGRKQDVITSIEGVQVLVGANGETTYLKVGVIFDSASNTGQALRAGATVTSVQTSPCVISLQFDGKYGHQILFPFPVDASNSILRIGRILSWVKVFVKPSTALAPGGYARETTMHQIICQHPHPPVLWGLPTLNIEKMVPMPPRKTSRLIQPYLLLAMNDVDLALKASELELRNSGIDYNDSPSDFKTSLSRVFQVAADQLGRGNSSEAIIHLACGSSFGLDTLLLLKGFRYDSEALSFVLEAYYVPLTKELSAEFAPNLANLAVYVTHLELSDKLIRHWKRYLCAAAERCRTWSHKDTCEYKKHGAPRSNEPWESPLCSCSIGSLEKDFGSNSLLHVFRKYAVQVAISPLFPVPYVERCGSVAGMERLSVAMNTAARTKAGSTEN